MEFNRNLDLNEVFSILNETLQNMSPENKIKAKRFLDKIADSDQFAIRSHEVFNSSKSIMMKSINDALDAKETNVTICVDPDIRAIYNASKNSYNLLIEKKEFLDSLDVKTIRKIARDINVAFLIKAKRLGYESE